MKCRNMVNGYVVWFGVAGDVSGQLNYADGADATVRSLEQRLSIIKGELWYQVNHGLPLLEKHTSKGVFDTAICSIILNHPDIVAIKTFTSSVVDHTYKFNGAFITRENQEIILTNSYSV